MEEKTNTPVVLPASVRWAYILLRIGFTVAPIAAGLDKFFNKLAYWDMYLSPVSAKLIIINRSAFFRLVGAVEIIAGIIVALKPRIGAYIVAAWLFCIIVNLLFMPGLYDIALRDVGLLIGAVALGLLSRNFD